MCQSQVKKYQFMIYLEYAKDYFLDYHSTHTFNSKEISLEALHYHDKKAVYEPLTLRTSASLTKRSRIVFKDQRYSVDDAVVLSFYNDDHLFGLVKSVLAFRGKYFWLVPS